MSNTASLKLLNFDKKDASEKEFKEIDMTWDSKDMYVVFKDGTKIQFRGFSGDNLSCWQGEVKGSKANQGKIGGGPVNLLLKIHDLKQVDVKVATKLKNKSQRGAVIGNLITGLDDLLGNKFDEDKFLDWWLDHHWAGHKGDFKVRETKKNWAKDHLKDYRKKDDASFFFPDDGLMPGDIPV